MFAASKLFCRVSAAPACPKGGHIAFWGMGARLLATQHASRHTELCSFDLGESIISQPESLTALINNNCSLLLSRLAGLHHCQGEEGAIMQSTPVSNARSSFVLLPGSLP